MKKRVLAGLLWFFATWYGWNLVASVTGTTELVGVVVGLAAGLLLAVDPFGRIWTGTPQVAVAASQDRTALAEFA